MGNILSELRAIAGSTVFLAALLSSSIILRLGSDRIGDASGTLILLLTGLSIAVFVMAGKAKEEFASQEKTDSQRREAQRKTEETERERQRLDEHRRKVIDQTLRRWLVAKIGVPSEIRLKILEFHTISPVKLIVAAVSTHIISNPDHFSSNSFFATIDVSLLDVEDVVFVDHGAVVFPEAIFRDFHQNQNANLLETIEEVYPLAEMPFFNAG